ncbi:MAG: hypothetical protein JRD49_09210 [Deltaproteobacteria bacterium]|nr:hypothetical protein [Deltaproteobacteria bacterium]MBW2633693.1 hypothetical protein [Deltaproteobacteria bacterium]MBW2677734.1 hypothetical protein [Deltaproteobacteria bacterium]
MKKWMSLLVILMFLGIMISPVIAANGPMGPADNSGDGIPDGSGFDGPNGPNGSDSANDSPGPAPNSGDGIPDGSGF